MTTTDTITALRIEAAENPAAKVIFEMWTKRQRARHRVTLAALKVRMKNAGHTFTEDLLCRTLRLVASLGFGNIMEDGKGNLLALVKVNTTLQSIGAAALGNDVALKPAKQRAKFKKLSKAEPRIVETPAPAAPAAAKDPVLAPIMDKVWNGPELDSAVSVAFIVNGKPVPFTIPKDLTPEETAEIVMRLLRGKGKAA